MAKYIVSAKLDAPASPLITVIYKIGINERQYSNLKNEIQENNVDWKIQPIQKNENGRIFIKKEI